MAVEPLGVELSLKGVAVISPIALATELALIKFSVLMNLIESYKSLVNSLSHFI